MPGRSFHRAKTDLTSLVAITVGAGYSDLDIMEGKSHEGLPSYSLDQPKRSG
jgi:hypothetical protein